MKIFLICPVRNSTEKQKKQMIKYIGDLEMQGNQVQILDTQ